MLDWPTFMRDKKRSDVKKTGTDSSEATGELPFDEGLEDLDIPTFLRKQMD